MAFKIIFASAAKATEMLRAASANCCCSRGFKNALERFGGAACNANVGPKRQQVASASGSQYELTASRSISSPPLSKRLIPKQVQEFGNFGQEQNMAKNGSWKREKVKFGKYVSDQVNAYGLQHFSHAPASLKPRAEDCQQDNTKKSQKWCNLLDDFEIKPIDGFAKRYTTEKAIRAKKVAELEQSMQNPPKHGANTGCGAQTERKNENRHKKRGKKASKLYHVESPSVSEITKTLKSLMAQAAELANDPDLEKGEKVVNSAEIINRKSIKKGTLQLEYFMSLSKASSEKPVDPIVERRRPVKFVPHKKKTDSPPLSLCQAFSQRNDVREQVYITSDADSENDIPLLNDGLMLVPRKRKMNIASNELTIAQKSATSSIGSSAEQSAEEDDKERSQRHAPLSAVHMLTIVADVQHLKNRTAFNQSTSLGEPNNATRNNESDSQNRGVPPPGSNLNMVRTNKNMKISNNMSTNTQTAATSGIGRSAEKSAEKDDKERS